MEMMEVKVEHENTVEEGGEGRPVEGHPPPSDEVKELSIKDDTQPQQETPIDGGSGSDEVISKISKSSNESKETDTQLVMQHVVY